MKFKEIIEKLKEVETIRGLVGATAEFNRTYDEKVQEIGLAICEETGLSKEEAAKLSPDTELSSQKLTETFDNFCIWFQTQQ